MRNRTPPRHVGPDGHLARQAPPGLVDAVPPETYFVGSAVFHYLGPAFAVLLFALMPPLGVAWLRIATAAAIFAAWRGPWRARGRPEAGERRLLLALGAALGTMNATFYLAIDGLPLGTVAAIEFLPVIALAALGLRKPRNLAALAAAVARRLPARRRPARRRAARLRVRLRERRALHRVHRARPPRLPEPARAGSTGSRAAMLVALAVALPLGGCGRRARVRRPGCCSRPRSA